MREDYSSSPFFDQTEECDALLYSDRQINEYIDQLEPDMISSNVSTINSLHQQAHGIREMFEDVGQLVSGQASGISGIENSFQDTRNLSKNISKEVKKDFYSENQKWKRNMMVIGVLVLINFLLILYLLFAQSGR